MKKLVLFICAFISLITMFMAGSLFSSFFLRSDILIVAHNHSGKLISSFTVTANKLSMSALAIENNERRKISFPYEAVGNYVVDVVFADGSRLHGDGGAYQSGYVFYEFVSATAIDHNLRSR